MKQPIILCDVDEVCADLLTEWVRRYNIDYEDTLSVEDIDQWDVAQCVKPECGKKMFDILRDPDLYDYVKPIPGALEGVRTLRKSGCRVVFVTSCVVDTTDAKIWWLIRNGFLPNQKVPRDFIAAKDKSLVRGDLLIDDGPHNNPTILYDQPHNRGVSHPRRVHSWKEVVEYVHELVW